MVDKSATAQLDAATEPFRRSDLALVRFTEFRRLWQSYRSALSHPFGKTREEDAMITSRVDAAFQALDQLSKEG